MTWSAVLLDLDGTILDSAPIICRAMSLATAEFGHPRPPEEFLPYVGPPLWHTFGEVTGEPPEVVERIVPRYREIYAELMGATQVFPGMPEVVRRLAAAGLPLAVATSKLRSAAISLLAGVGLAEEFVTIQGAGDTAASADKAAVIAAALADLRAAGADVGRPVMVGDRHHDIEGAAALDIPTILVSWGYAAPGEEEGAIAVAPDSAALADLLLDVQDAAAAPNRLR